jgi:hypothetical protein
VKLGLLLALCLALAACGGTKADPTATANRALLDAMPVYPGAAAPKTTTSGMGDVHFAARDWTLPANAQADTVVTWYEQRLQAAGWKLTGKSFETLRATRKSATISVGVRSRTLEAIANSEGA